MDKDIETIIAGFLAYLKKQKKTHLLPKILEVLEAKVEEEEKRGEIISALPLTQAQIRKVEEFLRTSLKKKIKLKNLIDERILGGLKIKFKDLLIDETVLGRLRRLKEEAYGY